MRVHEFILILVALVVACLVFCKEMDQLQQHLAAFQQQFAALDPQQKQIASAVLAGTVLLYAVQWVRNVKVRVISFLVKD